ncbi:hypothetical protein PVAND_016419 [Polypedilum vanderplanki]|uniref:Uncharacterized protein n=1 Tax=Polypedilum vanderplanki TaxID=319348 RepID=A0A9J6BFS6_POLVA|nr:hypothetical protein PVAND_016419 [Polypedilum vanderplanki]
MSKRPGCELSNNSKRLKSDNVMQPLQNYISQNHKFNLKSQASVTDPKTNNLFESDSDDEEIWIHASQVEQRVLGTQKITNKQEIQIETNSDELDISYASFQTAEGITSTQQQLTQNIPIIDLTMTSERANKIDPKIQILQNKCAALEKQLKKYKPNYAELSQRTNEMSELKERIRKLTNENDELRNEKLKNEIETVGEKESQKLKSENEELKKMIEKLIKEKNSNSDEEVTNDQENLRQKLNGSFVKPLSYKEKISEMEKCSMSFISTRVQSQNASNSSEVFKKPFDVSQKSQKSNLTVKQQEHLAKSSSQHHKLNFQAQKSSNLTSQHSNLSQKSSHLISSSSQKSLTSKSSNLSQKSSNNIPRTQSSSQVINLEEIDENQQNSSYKSRKSSIWNETDEAEIFVASNDIEVFDLIKKTECFNIFDEKDSNFENFPTTNLKIIKIENCGENFISKSSSAPENKNIEKFKLQASKSLPNLKKYSSEPQNIYQNFTTFSPSQIDYKEIPKDSNEISNLKFLITKIDKIEISELFNEISKVFVKISSSIKEVEMRRFNEHFMKQEFAFKQAQHFSQQHFADRELKTISKCDIKSLVSHKKLFDDEKRIEERRLISLVSIICKNSQKLCEKILTQNISSFDDFQTIVDEICEIIDPYILQSRLLYENSGIAISLSELLCSFSSHYEKFEKSEIIDEKLMKFFNHVLSMSTNSPKTLNKLTKFLINISKNSEFEIIKKFCIDFPSGIL